MALTTYFPPKYATAFIIYLGLESVATAGAFQANPTLASGDFKSYADGVLTGNLATLPTVTPAAGKMVKFSLSAAEMTGDNITVVCSDASGGEWKDMIFTLQTVARQIDDLTYPVTSGRSTAVNASGQVGVDWANVGSPSTTVALSGTTVATVTTTTTATNLTTNNDKTGYGLSAAAIQAIWDALTSALTTTNSIGKRIVDNLNATVSSRSTFDSTSASVTVGTNNDKTGYALSSAGVQAIWDALTSALTTAGSIGKLLVDNINATISSRMATFVYTTPPTVAQIDTQLSSTHGAGAWSTATGFATPTNVTNAQTAITAAIAALHNLSTTDIDARLTAYDGITQADLNTTQAAILAAIPAASAIVTAIKAYEVETGYSFDTVMKYAFALLRGKAVADDATDPASITYYAPDGTTARVTHSIVGANRTVS
jgi:hypothetical protein